MFRKVHCKGLAFFIWLTFGASLGLILLARVKGLTLFDEPSSSSQLVIAVAMFIPAISALITQRFILRKSLKELGWTRSPFSEYLRAYFVILFLFLINYGFTWMTIMKPDFSLESFINQFNPPLQLPIPAWMMIGALTALTLIGAPIFNLIPSLGEEIGWRGFLLPVLEPLGKHKAMLISSMIWAAWHSPMILLLGFAYGREVWPGVLLHFICVTGFGIWMASTWFKTRSTLLAAFMHAVFNAHAYGVWNVLFVSDSRLVIGAGGTIGAVICAGLGLGSMLLEKSPKTETAGQ